MGSFASCGPLAEILTKEQSLPNKFGECSPLGSLYRHRGKILLLGVDHDSNTSLHLAEARADWRSKNGSKKAFVLRKSSDINGRR